jgi:hypothetical protein
MQSITAETRTSIGLAPKRTHSIISTKHGHFYHLLQRNWHKNRHGSEADVLLPSIVRVNVRTMTVP